MPGASPGPRERGGTERYIWPEREGTNRDKRDMSQMSENTGNRCAAAAS
jgi:hypothetical protein